VNGVSMNWVNLLKELDPDIFNMKGGKKPRPSYHRRPRKLGGFPEVILPVKEVSKQNKFGEKPVIFMALDTSGSIGEAELSKFLSEVQGICLNAMPERVDLLYWDTDVASHEIYTQEKLSTLSSSTKPAGGGGTDVSCVSKYLKDNQIKPECVIVLTDGYIYGDWGTWNAPVLWTIVGGNKVVPPMGTTIHLD